jgi:negative regulator of flagellin synthesis FlgM
MNINNTKGISAKQIQQYEQNESLRKGKATQEEISSSIPQEKVEFSDTAKEMQQIKNAVDEIPDVRESKVEALKSQIENGTYNVNGEEVAEKIIGEAMLDIFA